MLYRLPVSGLGLAGSGWRPCGPGRTIASCRAGLYKGGMEPPAGFEPATCSLRVKFYWVFPDLF